MSRIKDYDQLVKFILIGRSGVGKSSLMVQFAENKFNEGNLTIEVDFRFKTLKVDGKNVKFQIWDTSGQDRLRRIISSYYKGADGIMMVYDVSDPKSYEDILKIWAIEVENYAQKKTPVILIGNKSDKERAVPKQIAQSYAASKNYDFQEVSAKTSDKVFDTIKNFGKKVIQSKTKPSSNYSPQQFPKKQVVQIIPQNIIKPNKSTCY